MEFAEIQNTTIYDLSSDISIVGKDLLYVARPNYVKYKVLDREFPYYSMNATVYDLSTLTRTIMLGKNETVSAVWSFTKSPIVDNWKLSGNVSKDVAATKWYADQMSARVIAHLNDLSDLIYNKHILNSYVGMIVFSTIGRASDIAKYFFKTKASNWSLIGQNYYLAGANKDDPEYTFGNHTKNKDNEDLKYNYTLKPEQVAIKKHVHSFSGSTSTSIGYKNSVGVALTGHGFYHSKGFDTGRGWRPATVVTSTQSFSASASANGNATIGNSTTRSNTSFDNMPNYVRLFIWRRTS